jgi:hypothetical protein
MDTAAADPKRPEAYADPSAAPEIRVFARAHEVVIVFNRPLGGITLSQDEARDVTRRLAQATIDVQRNMARLAQARGRASRLVKAAGAGPMPMPLP